MKKNIDYKLALMKTVFLGVFFISIFSVNAQQWSGNANTTDAIIRQGNVGIGLTQGTAPASKLTVKGVGSTSVDLQVNGRLKTGDTNNRGGVWLNSASTQFIGQIDATKLGLFNNGWKVALDTSGYLGIGTTSPKRNLEVVQKNSNGAFRIGWGSSYPSLVTDFGYPAAGGFVVNAKANGSWARMHFKCDDVEKFQINKTAVSSSVNFGVGTTSPAKNIHLNQDSKTGGFRIGWGSQYPALFTDFGYPAGGGLVINAKANGSWAKVTFKCDDITRMIVSKENVAVDGLFIAEEIEVKDVAADYVFEENYKLRSLEEVESYIKENKHLPGIAPASETIKGIKVGEFNEKLLEKIEELTLYVIDLKKQNDALKTKVSALEASVGK